MKELRMKNGEWRIIFFPDFLGLEHSERDDG